MMRRIARDWLCIAVCMTLLFSFTRVERLTGYGVIAESSDYNANGDYDIEIEPDQTCKMIEVLMKTARLAVVGGGYALRAKIPSTPQMSLPAVNTRTTISRWILLT